ncbi:MAG: TrkA family potassium uptake protein [Clostridia bacterium]|nr:TrkA family potassium uptake protein [Clostridia bacterium]
MKKEKNEIIIIGLGKFGMAAAKALSKYDCDVMAIDKSTNLVDEVSPFVTHAAIVNAIDKEALTELGIGNFDTAIIGIGDDLESSIMIALTLKELNVPNIIAKARDDMHTRLLTMIGVDKVIQPERDMAVRMVDSLMHKHLVEKMEFSKDYSIVEMKAHKNWVGKRLNELALRAKYQMNVICVKKELTDTTVFPNADYVIEETDNLMVIAPNKELDRMSRWE